MVQAVELLCFPYAGGNAGVFTAMCRALPNWVKPRALELPGRGRRFSQALHSDRRALLPQLVAEIGPTLRTPYALFGHSLGGLIAFELSHALIALGRPAPLALFVSATEAPVDRVRTTRPRPSSDAELLQTLRRLGGTPPEVLANAELMELMLPVLRADFALCEGPTQCGGEPLRCPIRAFYGEQDTLTQEHLARWQQETCSNFAVEGFAAGHFFLGSHASELAARVAHHLQAVMNDATAGQHRAQATFAP